MAKNLLKVWMADNTVTTDDKTDKIFVLETTSSVDQQFVLDRMAAKNPGLHRETMAASVNLYHEVLSELAMNGYSINTDFCRIVPQLKGLAKNNAWDPETNSIYVSLTQGKKLREAIKDTTVQILGDRQASIYINGTQDVATRATDLSATAGRNFTVLGKNIKLAGDDPSVGITLTAVGSGEITRLSADMVVVNDPSKVIVLLPSGLKDGEYTLTITTQYTPSKTLLKTPRQATQTIYIGEAPTGGGGSEGGGGDDDQEENPLG
ncbi:MAG: DUF4469 domain-containing protein [Bacteroides sp.]|nr:DUF4469 domain-containing protein [Bacteroides sp.]